MHGKNRDRLIFKIDKNSKNSERIILDRDIDIDKKLINNPDSY